MNPIYIDIVMLLLGVGFVFSGWRNGFIHTFGTLVGMVIGILTAGYAVVWLESSFHVLSNPVFAIVVFLIIMLVVSRLVGFFVDTVDKLWQIMSIVPFLKPINQMLGALLGVIEGLVLIAALIYFVKTYLPGSEYAVQVSHSYSAAFLAWTSQILVWLFPKIAQNR